MKIFDAFPSKYLKHADLGDRDREVVMQHVMMEQVSSPEKTAELLPILYFMGIPKGMVLNKTNAKVIAKGYGDETEGWRDMPIVLYPAVVPYGADMVDAIRVRLAAGRERVVSMNGFGSSGTIESRPLFPDAAARKEAAMTTLPKKDARDIYTKLQAEVDAHTALAGLGEWIEANTGRVRLLPPEWQEILRMRCEEKMLELQHKERGHDADGVVWEETEVRKAVPDDGLDIPAAFRRATPKPEPSLKDRLLVEVRDLTSPTDILRWSLGMSAKIGDVLTAAESEEVNAAVQAQMAVVMATQMPPVAHQRSLFK